MGSPTVCGGPMTPQQMAAHQQQQQGMMQGQTTPTGQYDQGGGFTVQMQQMPQGYSQGISESPGLCPEPLCLKIAFFQHFTRTYHCWWWGTTIYNVVE